MCLELEPFVPFLFSTGDFYEVDIFLMLVYFVYCNILT